MIFVSVTRLRIRSPRFLFGFSWYVLRSLMQARRTIGNNGVRIRKTVGRTFWTITLWNDESSMQAFRGSGAHRDAMPLLQHWCDEASLVHWQQESRSIPSWSASAERLKSEGRLSKVLHPSAEQGAGILVST